MKRLMTLIVLLTILFPFPARSQTIIDSLGNQLQLNTWTRFDQKHQFLHPNGNHYPTQGILWVHTKEKQWSNFLGWLTLTGLGWGLYDSYRHNYFKSWQTWDNVERFSIRLGGGWLWGWALDSPDKSACRVAGGITGIALGISTVHHTGWKPTLGDLGIVAGEIAITYSIGSLLDWVKPVRPKKAYTYIIR